MIERKQPASINSQERRWHRRFEPIAPMGSTQPIESDIQRDVNRAVAFDNARFQDPKAFFEMQMALIPIAPQEGSMTLPADR